MALKSRLFQDDDRLQSCQVHDPSHLTLGTKGHHVRLVQTALVNLGFGGIDGQEYIGGIYGRTTAEAVLRFKTSRNIVNRSYQTQPDNIVGKMTITTLDKEIIEFENRLFFFR